MERKLDEDIILGGLTILFTGMAVLVPVLGITLRLAIKPFFDSWAAIQRDRLAGEQNALLSRQVNLLEAEVQEMQRALEAVTEDRDFQRQLAGPVESRT